MKHGQRVKVARLITERGTYFDSLAELFQSGKVCIVDGVNEIDTGFVFVFLKDPGWGFRPEVPAELLELVR